MNQVGVSNKTLGKKIDFKLSCCQTWVTLALLSIEQLMAARAKSEEDIRRKLTCGEMCIPLFAQVDQQIQLNQQRNTNCEAVCCANTLHDKPDNRCH